MSMMITFRNTMCEGFKYKVAAFLSAKMTWFEFNLHYLPLCFIMILINTSKYESINQTCDTMMYQYSYTDIQQKAKDVNQ